MNKFIPIYFFMALLFLSLSCGYPDPGGRNNENISRRDLLLKSREDAMPHKYFSGVVSFYGGKFHGRKTANGETYNMNKLTAAHRTLPFGTLCRVTNIENEKQVVVRVNDRGPYVKNRVMDLSRAAAEKLGGLDDGLIRVRVEVIYFPEKD
ncbi:MAG: septal ring lytic transglycosylase RlpA family protein [Calditrichia bacterium]